MKKENILFLEKRGCDFWKDDQDAKMSDVGNYRVCTISENIEAKNGKRYFLEFSNCARYNYRKTHKVTGKPLKHVVKELENANGLAFNNEYTNDRGSWGDLKLSNEIYVQKLSYTKADILKVVNYISKEQYTSIEFANEIIKKVRKVAGYRENDILDNLYNVKIIQNDASYLVYQFTATDGASFEYEANQNIICG